MGRQPFRQTRPATSTTSTSMPGGELELMDSPRSLHEYLLKIIHVAKSSVVLMGKTLYYLKSEDKFKEAVGRGADTWADYLRQPEIGLSTQEANRCIQIYELLVLKLGYEERTISEIPAKNLHYLLPLVKKMNSKDEADELVADATLLSQKDFRERVVEKKIDELGLRREYEYILIRKVVQTGTMEKLHDITSEILMQTFDLPQYEEMS